MKLHEEFRLNKILNPKIWDINTEKLRPEVREKCIEIMNTFKDDLDIELDVVDLQIVGSNASYNYTPDSDMDLHIIANFDSADENMELITLVYDFYKSKFNKDHDISIHGVPVELYVQDVNSGITSNGIYSVLDNDWIKFPEPITDIPEYDLADDVEYWKSKAEEAISSKDIEQVKEIRNTLHLIRKNSIAVNGEYSEGNQLFKELRNLGVLDKLKQAKKDLETEQLTLEHLTR